MTKTQLLSTLLLASVFLLLPLIYCYHKPEKWKPKKKKSMNLWNKKKMRLFVCCCFCSISNLESKPRFLVQFIVLCDIYCYGWCHLFSILILAIIVNEFTIRINQVHYDGVVNLSEEALLFFFFYTISRSKMMQLLRKWWSRLFFSRL